MSEEILKVFLADLQTIRVVCQHCQTVIELEVKNLKTRIQGNACPICGNDFSMSPGSSPYLPLHELARIFHYLETVKDRVRVEFPVKIEKEQSAG